SFSMWKWRSMRPGTTVRPARSRRSAVAGSATDSAGPTRVTRSPSITTRPCSIGGAPEPSITRRLSRTSGRVWTPRACSASGPLTQINTRNVPTLEQAWTFDTGVKDLQVTPLVIDGIMHVTGGATVFALEPETGKVIWKYTSASGAVSRRGVAYWPGTGSVRARLFSGSGDGRMIALDARRGDLVTAFGEHGVVDLKASVRGDVDGKFMLITP